MEKMEELKDEPESIEIEEVIKRQKDEKDANIFISVGLWQRSAALDTQATPRRVVIR